EGATEILSHPAIFLVHVKHLYSAAMLSVARNDLDAAGKLLEQLGAVPRKYGQAKRSEIAIRERLWTIRLTMARKSLDFEAGRTITKEVRTAFSMDGSRIVGAMETSLAYACAELLMYAGQPSEALYWINWLRNRATSNARADLSYFSWVLFLLAHFDLGNTEVIRHELRATEKFFRTHSRFPDFEAILLDFLKNYLNTIDPHAKRTCIEKFQHALEKGLSSPQNPLLRHYFELLSWTKAHQEGMPIRDILAQKAKSDRT
ncbi:MAG: hypothetical protein AAF570_25385, partial [Bacteroidota bacterium]